MSENAELVVEVQVTLLQSWVGLSIDMGGSGIKLVYAHKDDVKDNKQKTRIGKLRVSIYRNKDLLRALQFLRENCHIERKGDAVPLVHTTGIGCRDRRDLIEKELNIRTVTVGEIDVFTLAFKYFVANMPQEKFLHLPSDEMLQEMQHVLEGFDKTIQGFLNSNKDMSHISIVPTRSISLELPILDVFPDLYPCLLFGITSCTWGIILQDGGTVFKHADISAGGGGKTFLGLGSVICRTVKTYDELIDLAEKGDNQNIDERMSEIITAEGQENWYSDLLPLPGQYEDNPFLLSKPASSHVDSFKQEDIIRALLGTMVRQQCELMCSHLLIWNVKHVFVGGSFTNRLLVRKMMEKEFQRQKMKFGYLLNGKGFDFQIHFSKYSGYLGALGAMLHNCGEPLPRNITTLPNIS